MTQRFEGQLARHTYSDLCIRHNIQTRAPEKRPKTKPMQATYASRKVTRQYPVSNIIAMMIWYRFLQPPGLLREPPDTEPGWDHTIQCEMRPSDPLEFDRWAASKASQFTVRRQVQVVEYARLMAKIAHGMCVAEFGVDSFEHYLPPYILGETNELAAVVGACVRSEDPSPVDHNLVWNIVPSPGGEYRITAELRLFALHGGPWVTVVVGKPTAALLEARLPR